MSRRGVRRDAGRAWDVTRESSASLRSSICVFGECAGSAAREVEKRETKCPYAKTPFARISHKVGNTRVCGKSRRARRGTRASTRLGRETWNVRFARVQSKQRETPRAPNSAAAQCLRRAGKHPRVRDIERSEN
jgi:hypothetical protein